MKNGSGVTACDIVNTLVERKTREYRTVLESFGRRMSKKQREDMIAAFGDGMRSMLLALEELEVITVVKG